MMNTKARYLPRWQLDGIGGVIVAVDVLRAFTTAAYAFAAGATSILLVSGVEEAIALSKANPGALIMGEDHGRRPDGFDLSNSPVAVASADVAGRTIVQRTSAGTQGVIAATGADRLFVASLVCASATARAVDSARLGAPTYVITGRFIDHPDGGEDDLITARFIEDLRTSGSADAASAARAVADSAEAERTLALGGSDSHPNDIAYATDVDRFDFAMEVERSDGLHRVVTRYFGESGAK
jgi:2-phosphosulfolactate phosphatase